MKHGSVMGGALLVAGTSIGGGMLALPVITGPGGFFPSLMLYFFCWLFMVCTGLLFLELSLWLHQDANIVTMAEKTLGVPGKALAWVLYLFLFYSLTLAYLVGCGDLASALFGGSINECMGTLLFAFLTAPILYAGARFIGSLNAWFMTGLFFFYFAFVFLGHSYVNPDFLMYRNWLVSLGALPIVFTAFAYQGIVPSLIAYLGYNAQKTRLAIILGSIMPLIGYIIWQWLILGIVPIEGPNGLMDALKKGQTAVYPLRNFIGSPWIYVVGQFFAFFALITSFFGVTLGLMDFLADSLKIKKDQKGKLLLCVLIFIPPLVISLIHPGLFLQALDLAGGFGCALLLGLLPILMVWRGRYHLGYTSSLPLPGGRFVLVLLFLFVLFEIAFEVLGRLSLI